MKIGFIGAGNMATAIIGGLLSSNFTPADIHVFDMDAEKLRVFSEKGLSVDENSLSVTENSDIIVLAVKPQNYKEVILSIKDSANSDKTFVSIAAGITISFVRENLGVDCPVVRVMPNTPLLLSKGATAICPSENVREDVFEVVRSMFATGGVAEILTEDKMDAVISVNGSSPAYFYLFAKAMADYAVGEGIEYEVAMNLICASMVGSAEMLRNSGDDPETLIKKVSSKGGTTLEALSVFYNNNFEGVVKDAMSACTKRAKELSAEA
ncbi:MAG: pyrroline-5-carboxylate reductase [Eubacteriales bacterium]|nr:pyrroline-5-carboxylate reductase [Eubacteriales bacterium]